MSTAPAPSTTRPPSTTEPPECRDLAEAYVSAFFALGAGTPLDPDATTVRLPVNRLEAIEAEALARGCEGFAGAACAAFAELEAQGLEATNLDPPPRC